MVSRDSDTNLNVLVEEELSSIALSYGEVFIAKIEQDCSFKCWITCNKCKNRFYSCENFLDHATNTHLKKKFFFETETEEIADVHIKEEYVQPVFNHGKDDIDEHCDIESKNVAAPPSVGDEDNKFDEHKSEYSHIDETTKSILSIEDMSVNRNKTKDKIKCKSVKNPKITLGYSNKKFKTNVKKPVGYSCPHCDKIFTSKSNQKKHFILAEVKPLFKCEECPARLTSAQTLRDHMRIHTGERPVKCKLCPKTFRTSQVLNTHMKAHVGEKKFSCSFCEKQFLTKASWQVHERVHTGEKPYQCEKCGEKFNNRSSLRSHKNRKHIINEDLIRPTNVDKEFSCLICGGRYRTLKLLKAHGRHHSMTKDYCCKICNEWFLTYKSIYTHINKKHGCSPKPKENYFLKGAWDSKRKK